MAACNMDGADVEILDPMGNNLYDEYYNDDHPDPLFSFNPNIKRLYGLQPEGEEFTSIPYTEFRTLLLTPYEKLDEADRTRKLSLCVKQQPKVASKTAKKLIPQVWTEWRPFLNVFNSSSYAIPHLINLFSYEKTKEDWKTKFKGLGLTGPALKNALLITRLGYKTPINLYKSIQLDPSILDSFVPPLTVETFGKI
jgi:hypothetical protein